MISLFYFFLLFFLFALEFDDDVFNESDDEGQGPGSLPVCKFLHVLNYPLID